MHACRSTLEDPTVTVYRVPDGPLGGTVAAQRFALRYPDRAQDAEALLVDPSSGSLVIVTKTLDGKGRVYVASHPAAGAVTTLRRVATVPLGGALQVTAGDVSADGRTVVLRTYDRLLVWSRRRAESLAHVFRRRPCGAAADLLSEGQGESVALTRHGRAIYTVPEGEHPELRRWARR